MQYSNAETSVVRGAGDTYRSKLNGQASVLIGLVVLACVSFAFVSLASWSVDDPSFSNANGKIAQNTAGFTGAVFADITMQFLGLASALALIAPAVWGWMCLLQKPVTNVRKRLITWPLGVLFATAALGCVFLPNSWPLPSGLGGVVGDLILKVPALFIGGYPEGFIAAILFSLLAIPALFLILVSTGLTHSASDQSQEFDIHDEEDDEHQSSGAWFLGAITHWYLLSRARYKRRKAASAAEKQPVSSEAHDPVVGPKTGYFARLKGAFDRLTSPPDDGLENYNSPGQIEPGFNNGPAFAADEAPLPPEMLDANHPGYGENVYNADEGDFSAREVDEQWAEHPVVGEVHQPSAQSLVKPMAQSPKPSARIVRDAQPSLLSLGEFELPSLHFLSEPKNVVKDKSLSTEALEQNARMLEGVLQDFGVKGEIINVRPGPVVTLYELEPAPGIKSSRVIGLADDIARSMSAIAARVAVVPGRNAIGIELPNQRRETVYLREILGSQTYETNKSKLPLILGKTIGGEPVIADLAKMPHLLVAGTTGSGKSVAINTMILSILYRLSPEKVKMIMIDPKMLELSIYDGIPHLLTPVVTDPKKAVVALKWTVREMEERYKKMSKLGVRNIDGYNSRLQQAGKKGESLSRTVQTGYDRETGEAIYETEHLDLEPMPFIVVVIDEMADLMMVAGKDIEGTIQRLAQMARAAGIHVIMATQRPSVDVITGTIKANFPTRISFQVTSKIDSRTILGEQGAEQLLGMGDMLYMAGGGRIQRVHGPFVDDPEVDKVVSHLKEQGVPEYLDSVTEEDEEPGGELAGNGGGDGLSESNDIYDQAVAIVLRDRKVSTSYIQRRLSIGYNRAASLIERMEQEGLISAANHAGKREILVPGEDETI